MAGATGEINQIQERSESRRRGQGHGGRMNILKVIRLSIMTNGTLVFESIIDRVMLVVTEEANEGVHV